MLVKLERDYPSIFAKAMNNFDYIKESRTTLNEQGMPVKLSWEDTLTQFYMGVSYDGVTQETIDIACVFKTKNISQAAFEQASNLRKEATEKGVPEHLLGTEIREETMQDAIERMRHCTAEELADAKTLVDELYSKQFTYEWLSKKDPRNSIMGLYCSCCGTITSAAYGKDVARASVVADDVQNIVVRNARGEIIAKGTMYLNKEHGYGVINDFEMNEEYRQDEINRSGRYITNSPLEQSRQQIFDAFQRGIRAFAAAYDQQNPDSPLQQVNVGMGYNRLKQQVEQYEQATEMLTVPAEYKFMDASTEQYVLYDRDAIIRER